MNDNTFNEHLYNLMEEVHSVLNGKGVEYRTNADVFSNFVTLGKQLGLTEYQIWTVYFTKHVTSIQNAIKNNPKNPDDKSMPESLDSRILDAIAYLCLLYGMTKR
jgi:hypothetical protein